MIALSRRLAWLVLGMSLMPGPGSAAQLCEVQSRQGWQTCSFPDPVSRLAQVSGGWSVDQRNYEPVGPRGHVGEAARRLKPHNARRFDHGAPFGGLLMQVEGYESIWIQGPGELPEPATWVRVRINDRDDSLGDNGGSLFLRFE